ncbi:tetratricopeptide repeat protein [Cellulosimicrobium cellulans]
MGWFDRFKPTRNEQAPAVSTLSPEEQEGLASLRRRAAAAIGHDPVGERITASGSVYFEDGAGRSVSHGTSPAQEAVSLVRGRHFTEWAEPIRELKREGRVDEALKLALECVDATERASRSDGLAPAPAYTTMAAIIYRQRKDYAAEIAILERYQRACPPGRKSSKITDRLAKTRELKAKASG